MLCWSEYQESQHDLSPSFVLHPSVPRGGARTKGPTMQSKYSFTYGCLLTKRGYWVGGEGAGREER